MKEYNRITKKDEQYGNYVQNEIGTVAISGYGKIHGTVIDYLAELEDKIENGTLIELPCIRKINSPLGAYEAVYINERDLMQECVVCTDKEGWLIVEKYGCPKHSEMAEQRLKELKDETKM